MYNIEINKENNSTIFRNEEIIFILYTKLHYKGKLNLTNEEIEKIILSKVYMLKPNDIDKGKVLRYMTSLFLKLYNNQYIEKSTTYNDIEWLLREFIDIELSDKKSLYEFLFAKIQWSDNFKKELETFDDSFLYEI